MKKQIIIGTGVTMVSFLAGCAETDINYKGEQLPVSKAEERMADELEVENPSFDLEVRIYEETYD